MQTKNTTAAAANAAPPGVIINVAVDAAYLGSQQTGPYAGTGIYMMDNALVSGSTGQGGMELSSVVNPGDGVAFNVFAVQQLGDNYTVQIEGIEVSSGENIFGNAGYPSQQAAGSMYQWLGTAMNTGQCIYQIKISVQGPVGAPGYFWWDPYLTCNA